MKDDYSYIEFKIENNDRFKYLQQLFEKLKEVKSTWVREMYPDEKQRVLDYKDPVDNFSWQDYLDEAAKAWFDNTFDFNNEEGLVYWKLWELTEPRIRLEHPFFRTPGNWHFESMLDAIFNGDYALIALVKEKDNYGCLYYNPRAYPFGGSHSLVELISAFGNRIIYDSWHKQNKPKKASQWNLELAKMLVKQGIGFTPELLEKRNS